MKKLFVVFICLMLSACGQNKVQEEITPEVVEEPEVIEMVGGWTINEDLPVINDAVFDEAISAYTGMNLEPLFVLGYQPVAGENIAYLTYGTAVVPSAKPAYKVVVVFNNLDENKAEITGVYDFDLTKYTQDQGTNTPEGLMGGWQDNGELNNMLDDDTNTVFEKALEGLVGVDYTPVALLANQVVAGSNYLFLAKGVSVTTEPINHLYVISVYEDLSGNVSLNNICGIDLSKVNE